CSVLDRHHAGLVVTSVRGELTDSQPDPAELNGPGEALVPGRGRPVLIPEAGKAAGGAECVDQRRGCPLCALQITLVPQQRVALDQTAERVSDSVRARHSVGPEDTVVEPAVRTLSGENP